MTELAASPILRNNFEASSQLPHAGGLGRRSGSAIGGRGVWLRIGNWGSE